MAVVKPGPGSCSICGTGGQGRFTPYEVRTINKRVQHEPLTAVAESIGVHPSSLRRHVLNHASRPAIVRDVRIDEDRSALDLIDDLVEQYDDANKIRVESLSRGNYAVSLRASNQARAIARQVWEALGVDVSTVGAFVADAEALVTAVRALVKKHPVVAQSLAAAATGDLRDELLRLHELALAAQQKAQKKETAA